jgi:subtilisin family serine protease
MASPKRLRDMTPAGDPPIIYVHGIGEQPPPVPLKREWDLALFGREMGDRTVMVYWSDVLHQIKRTRGVHAQASDRIDLDVDALLAQAGVKANDDTRFFAHALLETLGVRTVTTRTKVIPLPAFLRRPITRVFLNALIKDTAAYFFSTDLRRKIQNRFLDVISSQREKVVVVAHSQGSIVALDVLAHISKKAPVKVSHLVTIGSPLGIREIQDFLDSKLTVPDGIGAWNNFADPLDPVALDKGIANDFDPAGFIVDTKILNTHTRSLANFNPHSAIGYLAHPEVRTAVCAAAKVDTHARFLVARDAAADLALEGRNPVLIEILEPGYPAVGETPAEVQTHEAKQEGGRVELVHRIERAASKIEEIVGGNLTGKRRGEELRMASVDRLRRFVAARLTPSELSVVAHRHRDLRIYAVWKSTPKSKVLHRSSRVIQADAARSSYNAWGRGIRWAVLDTGIRSDHPHFAANRTIASMWDCTEAGPPKSLRVDLDRDGHGSHVAGIIAGESADQSIRGVAPLARLDIYKVLNDSGAGDDASIIKALDHIAMQNENNSDILIHGVNLSLGGPYDASVYGCGFTPICMELRRLWRAGVFVCVASGNEGQVEVTTADGEVELNSPMSIGDPANLEDCIAVGSVNTDHPHMYGVSSFSSRGPTSDGRVKPDVVAPGERIRSCNSRYRRKGPDDLYRFESGTSMAVPHVSGLIAAFLSVRPEFRGRPDEVKALMLRTCTDIKRDRYHQGHGIPNLMRMLLEA